MFCEDFGNGNWEIEYSVRILTVAMASRKASELIKRLCFCDITVWRPQPYPSPIRHICPQQTAPQPSNLDVVSRLRSFTLWICRWQLGTSSERRCQTRRIIERGAERDLGEKWEWRGCRGLGGCRLTIGWCMRILHICTCEWLIGFQMMVLRTQSPDAIAAYGLKANSYYQRCL